MIRFESSPLALRSPAESAESAAASTHGIEMNHRERGSSLLSDKQLTLSIPYGFSFSTGISVKVNHLFSLLILMPATSAIVPLMP